MMSEKTIILQNQRHKIFFRQERVEACFQWKVSCFNEVNKIVQRNGTIINYLTNVI